MKIKIYVQSCGVAQEHGYCWVDENQKIEEEPDLVKKAKDLIESEAPSVVLARNGDKLLLLVTGLKSSERRDYRGRTIRNSVAWVGQDTDEPTLRSIAARALLGSLEKEIDGAVKSGGEKGFEVSFEKIKTLTEATTNPAKSELLDSDKEKQKIGRTSDKLKRELASDLEKYRLPRQEPEHKSDNQQFVPLVVVTGIQDEETLQKAGVWRGLSSLVDSNSENWEDMKSYSNPAHNGLFQFLPNFINQRRPLGWLIPIIIISLSLNIWLYQQVGGQDRIRNLESQVQNLYAQKLDLENQVQPLRTQVHDLETQLQEKRTQRTDLQTVVKDLQTQKRNLENQVQGLENQVQALEKQICR
jgi:outer membrane murein-binding lipoprotein Lpp